MRGEFCEQIIVELGKIRERKADIRSFEDLDRLFPGFEIIQLLKNSPFDTEDRELVSHPNRWGYLVTYGCGILKRHFNVGSDETIKKYRKTYKAFLKSSHQLSPKRRSKS